MQYVYILECADKSTYTGCTGDMKERYNQHQIGSVPSTKSKLPVTLLFYCAFQNIDKAFAFEKYLKSGSSRAFMKKHLI